MLRSKSCYGVEKKADEKIAVMNRWTEISSFSYLGYD